MRAFLLACLAVLVIGAAGYCALDALQQPSGEAFATDSARIDPSWSWRTGLAAPSGSQCQPRKIWQWFFVDFRRPADELPVCSDSQ